MGPCWQGETCRISSLCVIPGHVMKAGLQDVYEHTCVTPSQGSQLPFCVLHISNFAAAGLALLQRLSLTILVRIILVILVSKH
ncbi:hypothetical protein CY34DRAFT_362322 [Suillus luteus UH-Slu-Lm8-n1]|uniref:Uncharacterized protein n=1 Tax=Suillus luteus UH-Slu-Lm8-n1 TaxID=930992 RepID=A0A0D0AB52_9AGAM|nr:hypothetical protein CY34DRAFT_362322 [Suillus luteus UH-Slu-Lm8-n1]